MAAFMADIVLDNIFTFTVTARLNLHLNEYRVGLSEQFKHVFKLSINLKSKFLKQMTHLPKMKSHKNGTDSMTITFRKYVNQNYA